MASVCSLPVPVGRPVVTLEASLDALLDDARYDGYAGHWVAARLTDRIPQVDPLERLRVRFPHAVSVRYAPQGPCPAPGSGAAGDAGDVGDADGAAWRRPVEAVVLEFLEEVRGLPPEPWARELVREAAELARSAGDR